VLLGEKRFLQLVVSASLEEFLLQAGQGYSLCKGGLFRHALGTGILCETFAGLTKKVPLDLAYTAGLLHDIGKVVLVALPTYLCIAALMTIIGSSLIDNQEANQAAMLSMVVLFMPIYAFVPLATNPNGALALALTFFPTTGITTVALRSLFMEVPSWQIALSAAIALAAAIFLIWLAGRSFRLAMLRYGQRLKFSELFGKTAHNMDAPVS
ncbi:MAG: HDOD domain-containing protein, partial [Candidatus Promineifilaceae bacterium]